VTIQMARVEADARPLLARADGRRIVRVKTGGRGVWLRVMHSDKEPEEMYVGGKGALEFTLPAHAALWARSKDGAASVAVDAEEAKS
jgi:hypothetical protein